MLLLLLKVLRLRLAISIRVASMMMLLLLLVEVGHLASSSFLLGCRVVSPLSLVLQRQ